MVERIGNEGGRMGGRSRTGRRFGEAEARDALQALEACRRSMLAVLTRAPIGSQAYRAAQDVVAAIDGLAEAITGDRERLWDPGHVCGAGERR